MTTGDQKQLLCWLDLETTGTDEHADFLLEIACVVTEPIPPFLEVPGVSRFEGVVLPPAGWHDRLAENKVVLPMHENNGLCEAVARRGGPIDDVASSCVDFLHRFELPLRLAGSGVSHFDRRWLKAVMPEVERCFDYPSMDVGCVRRLMKYAGRDDLIPPEGELPHRALGDALRHAEEFRRYARVIQDVHPKRPRFTLSSILVARGFVKAK